MNRAAQSPPWAFEAALCLLAPFFFVSFFFSILSPLPILYLYLGSGDFSRARLVALGSIPVGALICGLIGGPGAALGFVLIGGLPAVIVAELLVRRISVERAILAAALAVLLSLGLSFAIVNQRVDGKLKTILETQTANYVQSTTKELLERSDSGLSQSSRDQIKSLSEHPEMVWREAAGILIAGILLLCSLPVIALLRWNPKGFQSRLGIRRDFLRRWSAPEWFVWPSLACLALIIFEQEPYTTIANNLLKPLLVIYLLHGVSILSFYLDLFRVRGPLRALFYGMALFFLAPMIISFGFFDLWFKFRDRTKPSEKVRPNL